MNQLNPNTKLVLITTLCLIIFGSVLIFLSESGNSKINSDWFNRYYFALFHAVSARTAGFNTLPLENYTYVSAMFLIILMWIGASPGSTGGGVKTTTFSVTLLSFWNILKGKTRLEIFGRQIEQETITKAFMIIFSSILVLLTAAIILVWIEPNKLPIDLIFEATSAFATVGLSRNLTFYIGTGAKVILILLMFIGRIGVLTFFLLFFKPKGDGNYQLPKTGILVG